MGTLSTIHANGGLHANGGDVGVRDIVVGDVGGVGVLVSRLTIFSTGPSKPPVLHICIAYLYRRSVYR